MGQPKMPQVPAPCGGNVGPRIAQPKVSAGARAPAVPAACGGNVGPRAVQPKPAAVQRKAGRGVVQPFSNKAAGGEYRCEVGDTKIVLKDDKGMSRGFVDFIVGQNEISLKTIDTKSGKGPKGAGAMLVYQLAMTARAHGKTRILVTNATPDETGFYTHMGFGPDPAFMAEMSAAGMTSQQMDKIKFTTLSASVNTILSGASGSVVKNWSDPSWNKGGLYAGEDPAHGAMFTIPL